MKRVIGIGGIFFKANDPEKLAAWYKKHLGLDVQDWGGVSFQEGAGADLKPKRQSHIVWSPFEASTDYFKPSDKPFMINYRVHDLDALLAQLRSEGVDVDKVGCFALTSFFDRHGSTYAGQDPLRGCR